MRLYSLGLCESCGAKAIDRHHRDGDVGNNSAENIASLCRHCHMKEDGRLAALIEKGREVSAAIKKKSGDPPYPCINCGRFLPSNKARMRCSACKEWKTRHGHERPTEIPFDRSIHSGEVNSNTKFSSKMVEEIRARYAAGDVSQPQLAGEYHVSHSTIGRIVTGKVWKTAGGPLTNFQAAARKEKEKAA